MSDSVNQTVRKISSEGVVATLAGTAGVFSAGIDFGHPMMPTDIDGTGAEAKFAHPKGIAVGPDGTVYVADNIVSVSRMGVSYIRKIHSGRGGHDPSRIVGCNGQR